MRDCSVENSPQCVSPEEAAAVTVVELGREQRVAKVQAAEREHMPQSKLWEQIIPLRIWKDQASRCTANKDGPIRAVLTSALKTFSTQILCWGIKFW